MKLLFRQRLFSWFDSYDIYNESGDAVFTVKGQLSWGHCLHVLDRNGNHIATLKERVFSFFPAFCIYLGDDYAGCIRREFSLFRPHFTVDCCGWEVRGDFFAWDYEITDPTGRTVAAVSKQLLRMTDTYEIDVADPADALLALMVVLAIDAEKCSRGGH